MVSRAGRKEIANGNHVKYGHVKLSSGAVISVAYVRHNTETDSVVAYGLSLCSPKDQFSKKRGRLGAKKRLFKQLQEKSEQKLTGVIKSYNKEEKSLSLILKDCYFHKDFPAWLNLAELR